MGSKPAAAHRRESGRAILVGIALTYVVFGLAIFGLYSMISGLLSVIL